ncbi:MAG: hypothetical protein GY903_00945 [Fuerstiella sp.]|nr:hypothetical protein [Fuerstiella sp.]
MMDEKESASSSEPVKTTVQLAVANTENLYEVIDHYSEDLLRIDCDGEVTLSDKITVRNIDIDFNLNQLRILQACVQKAIELKEAML